MSPEQPQLFTTPATPKLRSRQARALELLTAAGPDGLHADELGAYLHEFKSNELYRHHRDQRCIDCARDGNRVLRSLRAQGLAKYTRGTPQTPGYWQVVGADRRSDLADDPRPPAVSYNEFPQGY